MRGQGKAVHAKLDPLASKQLVKLFKGMKFLPQRKALGKIMRQALRPAYNSMRSKAPKKTGRLRRSISTVVWMRRGEWLARLGPRYKGRNRAVYAHFAELGTKGGERTTRGRFTYPSGDGLIKTSNISHGGTKGQFFVKKTVESYGPSIQARVIEKSEKFVADYWNKNAPKR